MRRDLMFALRTLGHSRGFATAAILTLALGIGANAIVFGVVDALLIRPLPFGEASDRLVTLHSTHPTQAQDWDNSGISYPDLVDIRAAAGTLEAVEGALMRNFSVSNGRDTERLRGASITPGLFRMLGVEPQLGRSFDDADAAPPGLESVALISDGLWRRAFAASTSVPGQPVMLNGRAVTIVGVMPRYFAFPEHQDVWLPLRLPLDEGRDRRAVLAFGVLRAGVDVGAAREELRSVAATLAARHPTTNRDWGLHAIPMRELFVQEATRRALGSMMVAVGLVLLIGCANVASLFIARGFARQGELSVRRALGAGRAGLVRLLLAESIVLSVAGGGLGLLVAVWGLEALVASTPEPPPYWARIALDGRMVGFVAVLSAATAILSGLVPALRATRADVAGGLRPGHRSAGATVSQRRLQSALVAGQVAVSFALLVGATLLMTSALRLATAETGFDPRPLLSLRTYIAGDAYDDPVARAQAVERLVDRIRVLPGVSAAAATGAIPADDGGQSIGIVPPDGDTGEGQEIGAQQIPITRGFLETFGLSLVEGRSFTAQEALRPDTEAVLINQRLAARLWPGQSAVGRPLRLAGEPGRRVRVVGVVPDLVYEELGEETPQSQLAVYVPYVQLGWRTMAIVVRAPSGPAALAAPVRRVIQEVDPVFAAFDVLTMDDRRAATQWGERFLGRTFALFAVAALLLVCIGTYGLTAYSAVQRTREIGLRLAVGATRPDIVRLLLGRGARLAVVGLAIGAPLAVGGARLLERLLFQVSAWNPMFWLAVPAALLGPILLANYLPARRASLADPAEALRQE